MKASAFSITNLLCHFRRDMFMNTVRSILRLSQLMLILIQLSACLTATSANAWGQPPEAPKNTAIAILRN